MSKSVYQDVIQSVLTAAEEFEREKLSLQAYQAAVFNAEQQIVLIEEADLRVLLLNHENEIELIRFTTESPTEVFEAIKMLRIGLQRWI